jgi:hypothetical protein
MVLPDSNVLLKIREWGKSDFPFASLNISSEIISREMGYTDKNIKPSILDQMESIVDQANDKVFASGGFLIWPMVVVDENIIINEKKFSVGNKLLHYLKGSEFAAVFICTSGAQLDQWASELNAGDDLLGSYIVDTLGSIIAEKIADDLQDQIRQLAKENYLSITNRYSPGYCDWHVSEQQKLFKLVPEKPCGVVLTESSLMIPKKSVSGIIGLGKDLKIQPYQCDLCHQTNCPKNK